MRHDPGATVGIQWGIFVRAAGGRARCSRRARACVPSTARSRRTLAADDDDFAAPPPEPRGRRAGATDSAAVTEVLGERPDWSGEPPEAPGRAPRSEPSAPREPSEEPTRRSDDERLF